MGTDNRPRFSVILESSGNASDARLTLRSLRRQSLGSWECLATPRDVGVWHWWSEPRFVVRRSGLRGGRPSPRGEHWLNLRAGDVLAPQALELLASALEARPGCLLLSADEDRFDPATRARVAGLLKPDWAPELLLSRPYLGRMVALRADVAETAAHDGAEGGTALIMRAALNIWETNGSAAHLPACLLHTPLVPEQENAAASLRDGLSALAEFSRRRLGGEAALQVEGGRWRFTSETVFPQPAVSVLVIASALWIDSLPAALNSMIMRTDYPEWELVVALEDGCIPEELRTLAARYPARVRLVVGKGVLTPRLMNLAARAAANPVLAFLDAANLPDDPRFLSTWVRGLSWPQVGAVVPLIVDKEGTIHSAGLRLGAGRICGPDFHGARGSSEPLFMGVDEPHPVFAASARAMLVRRSTFELVGEFDERYAWSLFDAEWSMRLRERGLHVLVDSDVRLKTRGEPENLSHEDAFLFLAALDAAGLRVDPYTHPHLDAHAAAPTLRAPSAPDPVCLLRQVREAIEAAGRPGEIFDVCNNAEFGSFLTRQGITFEFPAAEPGAVEGDVWSASRWILQRLRSSPEVRSRFPRALSEGAAGTFARWVCGEDAAAHGLRDAAVARLEEAFAADPGSAILHLFRWRWDWRFYFPLALLPEGRAALLVWQRTFGRGLPLRDEQLWWFLMETDEDPVAALTRTWRLMPEWQARHPLGLTIAGSADFASWLLDLYGLRTDRWIQADPAPITTDNRQRDHGVNVLGHLNLPCGLQRVAEAFAQAVSRRGIPVARRDIPAREASEPRVPSSLLSVENFGVTVLFLAPFWPLAAFYERAGLNPRAGVRHVGYWYWEFNELPESWLDNARDYREIWAPSRFLESAYRRAFPDRVVAMPPGIAIAPPHLRRSELGLPAERFLFLFAFDMGSGLERKNPLGLIRAFRRAFPDPREPATLVLKVLRERQHDEALQRLRREADSSSVLIVDEILSESRLLGLINACDAYVSLHRSEGLGLTMAEAMLMGKPTIATAYSGNLDFMTPENSYLVPYRLVPVERDWFPYRKGWLWAEPSEEAAAARMREVYDQRDQSRERGLLGMQDARDHFDMEAAGERYQRRLAALGTRSS